MLLASNLLLHSTLSSFVFKNHWGKTYRLRLGPQGFDTTWATKKEVGILGKKYKNFEKDGPSHKALTQSEQQMSKATGFDTVWNLEEG